ncbi:MAG TPA: glycosyltransferase family 2 protein [Candidatus Polarisedimenticolia bacterium]|jgi:glycosyltransferase involved in cell wall biosynthesis|nr:glycosyltransferase family 2 protein [Candidatus Polarisedimenticolia bacterium]
MTSTQLSVVIPVRDEWGNLRPLWTELCGVLEESGRSFEVVLVDDASTDGSSALLDDLARSDARLRIVHLEHPAGQSAALDAGFHAAGGEFVVTLDADLQSDPADIPPMLCALGTLDALIGYRARRMDSPLRLLLSRMANHVRNRLLGESIRDTGCPLKVFRRSSLQRLKLFDGMHRFLPALMVLEGFSVGQIAVRHRPRRWGRSKYGPQTRLLRPMVDLLAVRWMKRRRLDYRVRNERELSERERSSRSG